VRCEGEREYLGICGTKGEGKNPKKTPAKFIAGVLLWSKYDLTAG
jgi:hypothetical protein